MSRATRLIPLVLFTAIAVLSGRAWGDATVVLNMPEAGHATVSINDAAGKRVRNLIADLPLEAGEHKLEWDGRDDAGELVQPGDYRWVGLRRGEMHAVYRGAFQPGSPPWVYGETGGWIADHSPAVTVVAVGDRMILGATEAEWGHGVVATDVDGKKKWGIRWLQKRAWCGGDSIVSADGRVFATSTPDQCAIWEVDPQTGDNWLVVEKADLPPDRVTSKTGPHLRVVGAHGDEVFACDVSAATPATYVFRVSSAGQRLKFDRVLPIAPFALAWLKDGACLGAMDRSIDRIDLATGATTPFVASGLSQPYGLAVDAQDRVYVSDQGATGFHKKTPFGQLGWRWMRLDGPSSQQVKIFDSGGKLLAELGKRGGQQIGVFDPQSFFQPAGLAIDARGKLWVTELNFSPKRVTIWSIPSDLAGASPQLEKQFVGPANYGGGLAMIDPKAPWRLLDVNYGHILSTDLASGAYDVESLPWRQHDPWKEQGDRPELPFTGRPGVIIEIDGRKFTATQGGYYHGADARWSPYRFGGSGAVMIGEYVGERFVPQAALGNLRLWMRGRELNTRREVQWMPTCILDAAKRLPEWPRYAKQMKMEPGAPDVPHVEHVRGSKDWIVHPWPAEISGFIWVDDNADQRVQPEEITFHEMGDSETFVLDRDLNAYFSSEPHEGAPLQGVYKLPRNGFTERGGVRYSWDKLQKLSDEPLDIWQVGSDGSLLTFTALYDAAGRTMWTYPSSVDGVRSLGSRARETVRPGRINRVSNLWGIAPGPNDLGEVYMLHNLDGCLYLMTRRDGLFISTLFRPYAFADGWDSIVRAEPGMNLENYSLQDECFNGHFVRAEESGRGFEAGKYYVVGAGRSAVVEVTGLEGVRRLDGGSLRLVAGQGLYGKNQRFDPAAPTVTLASKRTVPPLVAPLAKPRQDIYAAAKPAQWLGSTVRIAWSEQGLHFKWEVAGDKTPFVNRERDFTQLFSTGDALDVQLDSPTQGKLRFIVAMRDKEPVIVRMRFNAPAGPDSVTYRSDILQTNAEVTKLNEAPGVRIVRADAYVVQFTIPWKSVGIDKPESGMKLPIELGLIESDPTGTNAASRDYWFSGASEMVSDVPTEARPTTTRGTIELGQ